jgi:hypothetical protein
MRLHPLLLVSVVLLASGVPLFAQEVLTATPEGNGTINYLSPANGGPYLGMDPSNPLGVGNQSNNAQQIAIMKFTLPTITPDQAFTTSSFSFDFMSRYFSPAALNDVSVGVYFPANTDSTLVTNADYAESLGATIIASNLITPTSSFGAYTISDGTLDSSIQSAYAAGDTSIAFSFTAPVQSGGTDVYFLEAANGTDPGTTIPSLSIITSASEAPEPSSLALLAGGLAMMVVMVRRSVLRRPLN